MTHIIFGAGAVGTSLAAQFTEAGIATLLVARGAQLAHLRAHPLRYQRPGGTSEIRLAVSDFESLQLGAEDVLFLAVKGQDVEELTAKLADLPLTGGGSAADLPVVTLQNGIEAERLTARRFVRHYAAVVRVPAIYTRTGEVRVLAEPQFATFVLGRFPEGRDAVSARLVADLARANALVEERADIQRWKSEKLVYNVRNVLELFSGSEAEMARVGDALSAEAAEILTAAGLAPGRAEERQVSHAGWKTWRDPGDPGGQSTWQSFTRGARSEVDFLNGEIVLQARLLGRSAPWNAAAQRLAAELAACSGRPGDIALDRLVSLAQSEPAARASGPN